jgi:predicted alternative tryptophan synthase beta-subunit
LFPLIGLFLLNDAKPFSAGGLRYHGMAPLISHVYELGFMEAMSIKQTECFEGAANYLTFLFSSVATFLSRHETAVSEFCC